MDVQRFPHIRMGYTVLPPSDFRLPQRLQASYAKAPPGAALLVIGFVDHLHTCKERYGGAVPPHSDTRRGDGPTAPLRAYR